MLPPTKRLAMTSELSYLSKCSTCCSKFDDRHQWYHHNRWASYAPAQIVCPIGIEIIVILQRLMANQTIHDYEEQEYWRHKFPANSPINARIEAHHITYIVTESICTIDPTNGYRFKEHSWKKKFSISIYIEWLRQNNIFNSMWICIFTNKWK